MWIKTPSFSRIKNKKSKIKLKNYKQNLIFFYCLFIIQFIHGIKSTTKIEKSELNTTT